MKYILSCRTVCVINCLFVIQGRCTESEKRLGNDVVYRLWGLHDYTRSCMMCLLVPALPTSLNPRDWNVGM